MPELGRSDGRGECIKWRQQAPGELHEKSRDGSPPHAHTSFRMKSIIAASLVFAAGVAADRTFTVYNGCPFTIWYVPPQSSGPTST